MWRTPWTRFWRWTQTYGIKVLYKFSFTIFWAEKLIRLEITKLNSLTQQELQQFLSNQAKLGLPGVNAHKIIFPERPNVSASNAFDRKNEKLAAVLIVFQKINTEWHIVLIKRQATSIWRNTLRANGLSGWPNWKRRPQFFRNGA